MSERLKEIVAHMGALLEEAEAIVGIDDDPLDPAQNYPRIVAIDGAALELYAPLAADWIPSMHARELTRLGSYGSEPSNGGQFGQPLRSAAGYPLIYTPDGFGGFRQVQVNYDGVNFPDDLAVQVYKKAVAESRAAGARNGGTFSPGPPRS
jgi:hypothetical protein